MYGTRHISDWGQIPRRAIIVLLAWSVISSLTLPGCTIADSRSIDLEWNETTSDALCFAPALPPELLRLVPRDAEGVQYTRSIERKGKAYEDWAIFTLRNLSRESATWKNLLTGMVDLGFQCAPEYSEELLTELPGSDVWAKRAKYLELVREDMFATVSLSRSKDTLRGMISIQWPRRSWEPNVSERWYDEDVDLPASILTPTAFGFRLSRDKSTLITYGGRNADGRTMSTVTVWDVRTGVQRRTFFLNDRLNDVSISPDGEAIVIVTDGHQELSHLAWRKGIVTRISSVSNVLACAYVRSHMLLALNNTGVLYSIDPTNGTVSRVLDLEDQPANELLVSADGRSVLIRVVGGVVREVDVESWQMVGTVSFGNSAPVMAVSRDHDLVAAAEGSSLEVRNARTGTTVLRTMANTYITAMQFSPCGKYLAIAAFDEIRIADIDTASWVRTCYSAIGGATGLEFSDNNEWLIYSITNGAIRCVQWRTGDEGIWWNRWKQDH